MAKPKLTPKQKELFNLISSALRQQTAVNYIANGYENGTNSYLKACKKLKRKPSKNPETSASEILSYPNVKAFIDSIKIIAAEDTRIDAAWVLKEMKSIHELDVTDICSCDGSLLPLSEWPKPWRIYISGLDLSEVKIGDDINAVIKKIKWPDKAKNLEMIGKHVDVQAWNEKTSSDTTVIITKANDVEW